MAATFDYRALFLTLFLLSMIVSSSAPASTSRDVTATAPFPAEIRPSGYLTDSASWNSAVSCDSTLATLEEVVGSVPIERALGEPETQGADYSGGGFRLAGDLPYGSNTANWPFSKRSTSPPCSVLVDGVVVPTYVEVHNVKVNSVTTEDCIIVNGFQTCDQTFNICNTAFAPSCNLAYPDTMHKIHVEIDQMWNASGMAPPPPMSSTFIDLQGFVYWDPEHTDANWHSYSGWEIHPLAAWRLSTPPSLFEPDWADQDNNGQIELFDLALAATCFNHSTSSTDWSSCSYWDFYMNDRVEIVDLAYAASYYGRTLTEPFPGQGQPVGAMDPRWSQMCSLLNTVVDRAYCIARLT